jgi:hypothetical protein
MLGRILTSNWVAVPMLLIAGGSVGLLYHKGRIDEAYIGAGLVALAAVLVILGSRKKGIDEDFPQE